MITAADLWQVSYTVAGIAAAAAVAGMIVLRLLATRSVATSVAVVAAVTVVATLAGVCVISLEMFIARKDLDVILAVVAVAGIAGFTVALLLGRRVSAASRLLLSAVREVGTGGDYRPPSSVLPAELAELSAGVRNAHGQLAAARDRERALEVSRRELVAWVSHDLRTPLAGLRAMSEALEDGVITDWPTISRYHKQIREETDRLALMIDDLFELSRIHAGALRLSRQVADLGDLIDEALTRAGPLAQAKGARLRGPAEPGIPVEVDAAEVGRALLNLVVNAIRHTPAGGVVEVLAGQEPDMATVTVADSCGGIPAEHLSRVFDVGFRGETARTPVAGEGPASASASPRASSKRTAGRSPCATPGAAASSSSGCRWPPAPPAAHRGPD